MNKKTEKNLKIQIINHYLNHELACQLQQTLNSLDLETILGESDSILPEFVIFDLNELHADQLQSIDSLVENAIRKLPIDFDNLPILVEGESKIVKSLNEKIVLERFKPTVYSYSINRYGTVDETEELRARFTADVFRQMHRENTKKGNRDLQNAFLASIETSNGTLIAQRKLTPGNLEVRVKRYHIGSPVHRYKFSEQHPTVREGNKPLEKWDRFDRPIVCFDWRHPLVDNNGVRLADEPISDDYASIWIEDIHSAKQLSSNTFLFLEKLFYDAGLTLIDICFFVDQSGQYIFGEISPDCMRVREGISEHPSLTESLDKDLWRNGEKETLLAQRYNRLHNLIFNNNQTINNHEQTNLKKQKT